MPNLQDSSPRAEHKRPPECSQRGPKKDLFVRNLRHLHAETKRPKSARKGPTRLHSARGGCESKGCSQDSEGPTRPIVQRGLKTGRHSKNRRSLAPPASR
ncbi:hypothetical protein M3Y99_01922600 [Aphelenchoides fujianensis]|nr:hypothetical protein M3Y99_01922600 [Aphelenchoides fujianensis]